MSRGLFDSSTKITSRKSEPEQGDWTIAKGLSEFRRERKLTQGEMAKLMGVSIRAYQGYERGEHAVQTTAIETLSRNTGVDLSFLMTGNTLEPDKDQLQAWALQILDANKYVRSVASEMTDAQTEKIVLTYFKLDYSDAKFSPEKIDPIIEMLKS